MRVFDVLAFLARRIEDDPIVLVNATGVDAGALGLEELRLAALCDGEAVELLGQVAPDCFLILLPQAAPVTVALLHCQFGLTKTDLSV